ncbi:inositol monophosphatase family protein [Acuticoccus kandeliae]|uniref:inositol monophosphatase family protein n=1 Tax=Acuticoccus kandeliae TaxID=2073160 RepID=UPI001300A21C|nr:3'(2'),5'-bisphosphate nucleotidase CysQ [Acuticoccus kandeliae]
MEEDLALLREAVQEGGAIATGFFGGSIKQWNKGDGSPVSDADIAVDEILSERLRRARPDYGWISEEIGIAPGMASRAFVVDPIDGTRAFLRGESAWTVVAAVIEDGRPIASVVLRPVTGEFYEARRGHGAYRNGERVSVARRRGLDGAHVSMPGPLFRAAGFRDMGVARAGSVPSLALRLAKVSDGQLDAVITKQGPHHWDLAAADLIVHEAGGTLTSLDGTVPRYDSVVTAHAPVVAGPPDLADRLRRMAAAFVADAA